MLLKLKKVSNHKNKKSRSGESQCISIKKIRSEYILSKSSYLTGHVFRKASLKAVKTVKNALNDP